MTSDPPDVTIRELHSPDDYAACVALQDETWGESFSERVPPAILRVGQLIGGVTAGAFDPQHRLVGFVFGLTGIRDGRLVHWSDMLAVREERRGQGLGERLKQYQRDCVRRSGVTIMLWTYDPLVARNAHFNFNRLGARPIEYRPDMYGSNTGSALHGALPTDRFIVQWELDRPSPSAEPVASSPDALTANPLAPDGRPVLAMIDDRPPAWRVQIPRDLAEVQRAGPESAMRWRLVVREVIQALMTRGYAATGFVRRTDSLPFYLFTRSARRRTA
jgi:predicted GNAT superfamily acetyltransferase